MKGSVRKRGEKWSYYFNIKVDGVYKKKEKGGFSSKKEAETALREVLQQYEKHGFVQNNINYTLQEYTQYWYDTIAIHYLKYNSLRLYEQVIRLYIVPELGFIKLTAITPLTLQKFFSEKQKILSNSSINAIKNVLNNTFKLAIKQNILLVNPMKQIELKNKPTSRTATSLNDEELKVIFNAIPNTHFYIPCMIGLHTGARCGEILALTWDDINFESNTVTFNKSLLYKGKEGVEISTTKTISSIRTIKMTTTLVDVLLGWKKKQESNKDFYGEKYYYEQSFVCTHEDGYPINPTHFSTQIARLSKKINVPFNFHQLRHTHATKLIESDVNIKVIQERLGHHSIATTLNVYSHVTRNLEDEAMNKFESNLNI